MVRKYRLHAVVGAAVLVLGLAISVAAASGCGLKGESGQVTQEPTVTGANLISGTSIITGDIPIDYGPFRIIPSNHPEAEIFYRKTTPDPQRTFLQINTITDARKIVLQFKEPTFLPEGFAAAAIEGVFGSDGSYYVITAYRGQGQAIEVLQMPVSQKPIPISMPVNSPVQDMQVGQVNGMPAIMLVPKKERPATNPRRLRWVQEGVDLTLNGAQFADWDILMRVAVSMK